MNIHVVLTQLSTEDKITLCTGKDLWRLASFDVLGIPEITLANGPHGVSNQIDDTNQFGIADSDPSVCFPNACLSACSWDKDLLYRMGQMIGEEAVAQKISVVLGPGVNIKRHPLCGRNFEYFSEDPLLSGWMGASFIQGVQSQGVGASLKHFAANNQELDRMSSSSNIDPRALRELYLKPFEIAIKHAQPWTVMASYNKINGIHSSTNPWLLTTILRETWGFSGAVISDWGAAHDRDRDLKAGLDLEMPGNGSYYHQQVLDALESGSLKMEELDRSALRILDLINKSIPSLRRQLTIDQDAHRNFARKVAQESIVLLKNKTGLLPLEPNNPILVLGELAQLPRIQGSGSAHVHPLKVESLLDGLRETKANFIYRKATNSLDNHDVSLIESDTQDITADQVVVVCVGLNEDDELEGLDRVDLHLPQSHTSLINAVLAKTNKVVVVLFGGAPVDMPWEASVSTILNTYLPGEAGGLALADILYGKINPSGKLAETYPVQLDDIPSSAWFGTEAKEVNYRESLFVGYRYFDSANKAVRFPFGHGLSYTTFEYRDLSYAQNVVSFTLANIGDKAGSEVVQIYISNQSGANYFPIHELKAFEKINLKEGESRVIHIALDESAFQYYDSSLERFVCANGIYEIQVGASSRDIRLSQKIVLESQDPQHVEESWKKLWVGTLKDRPTDADFEALIGHPIRKDKATKHGEYTIDSTLDDLNPTLIGKIMRLVSKKMLMDVTKTSLSDTKSMQFKVLYVMVMAMPLRNTMLMSHGRFSESLAYGIIDCANGHWQSGFKKMIKKEPV